MYVCQYDWNQLKTQNGKLKLNIAYSKDFESVNWILHEIYAQIDCLPEEKKIFDNQFSFHKINQKLEWMGKVGRKNDKDQINLFNMWEEEKSSILYNNYVYGIV